MYVEKLMQKIMSSSIRFHAILLRDGIHCGTHYSATKGKSHYPKCAQNIYHKQCKENVPNVATYLIWISIFE